MGEPPNDMTPAEVGSLMDELGEVELATSPPKVLVDSAVQRWYWRRARPAVPLFPQRDYTFHLLKPSDG